ncbi:MAG: hypothetical protein OJF49_003966 [Ktedonobacterales bacterium]|nr:MAG: hypothetical protein OJF49_003966 [Ktedonobacterales bacterium]
MRLPRAAVTRQETVRVVRASVRSLRWLYGTNWHRGTVYAATATL